MVITLAKVKGVTLGELADHIGTHRNSLTEKVARRRPFDEDEIILAAEKLGVPPGKLFEDPYELLGIIERSRCTGASDNPPTLRIAA
jgi:lambda repressor-like predicted transcriptional regulator